MSEKRYALLIDTENTSPRYIDNILKEITQYGTVTYKRMYGDFSSDGLYEWNKKAIEHAIVQIQQPRYSKAKNSSDIMLVIDAMDILYNGTVEGFCIVSSDSDFTRLVNRLCEAGMEVIGMGKSDASKALKAACTQFKNLEILGDKEEENAVSEIVDLGDIKEVIADVITKKEDKGKMAGLGEIGSTLMKAYSDFDVRNYGYKSLYTFVDDMKEFKIVKSGTNVMVKNSRVKGLKEVVEDYVRTVLEGGPMELGMLANYIHNAYEDFKMQEFGYSKFERFISSVDGVKIELGSGEKPQKMARLQ